MSRGPPGAGERCARLRSRTVRAKRTYAARSQSGGSDSTRTESVRRPQLSEVWASQASLGWMGRRVGSRKKVDKKMCPTQSASWGEGIQTKVRRGLGIVGFDQTTVSVGAQPGPRTVLSEKREGGPAHFERKEKGYGHCRVKRRKEVTDLMT